MITIRPAKPDEISALHSLRNRSAAVGCAACYSAADLDAWLSGPLPAGFARLIEAGTVFVAEADGRLLGYGALDLPARLVEAIFVDPAAFGRGAGRALLQAVETRAVEEGLDELSVSSSLNAEAFYAAAGYVALEREQHPLSGGGSLTAVRMRKRLRSAQDSLESLTERLAQITGWDDFRDVKHLLSDWKPANVYEFLFPLAISSRDEAPSGIAGRLLIALQPDCPESLADVIAKVHASRWFVSYREIPFYLITQFGKPAVVAAARAFMAALPPTANSRVDTILYWALRPASSLCEPFHSWETETMLSS
ncbi:MAG: hypothetical protein BGP24_20600 [Lysobacterales bacterium 69-70]|nr:GNAT family N-acetyltransferase [Xanthomonadaceae bacterium]ODU35880.1 MAG: hypothetical protein ABS97_03400 [Xanthomonadaceae bacterium SCN 69-320]ODV18382.1 MAG: hypothetical protein ABT27_14045 [Xanthomonadaceae bacterium SCN 69-25]OJY97363.1 MAG: hypothetical protein BGP24_20600 [Xanthomonadales bacterium 69-70]